MYYKSWFLILMYVLVFLSCNVESRGGRGGRGGSFGGGVFGSWRKYKKPSNNQSNGKTRRIVSSSPMHTPLTKSLAEDRKTNNYPVSLFKKKFIGQNKYYRRHNLPPGGSYYNDLDRIPHNAVFVSQMPPRSSDATDFLATYLGFTLGWHSVLLPHQLNHNYQMEYNRMPIDLNAATNPETPENIIYTKKLIINNRHNESLPLVATGDVANIVNPMDKNYSNRTASIMTANANARQMNNLTAPWGVICITMKFNETHANTEGENIIDKLICYPAPPPTSSADDVPPISNSYHSNNLSNHLAATKLPIQVAGDIIDSEDT